MSWQLFFQIIALMGILWFMVVTIVGMFRSGKKETQQ